MSKLSHDGQPALMAVVKPPITFVCILSVLKVVFFLWAELASVKCVTLTSHHCSHTRTHSTDKGFHFLAFVWWSLVRKGGTNRPLTL